MTKEELKKSQADLIIRQRQFNNHCKNINIQLKQLSALVDELREKIEWESKTPFEKKQILLKNKKDKLENDFK